MLIMDPPESIEQATGQRDNLAKALHGLLVQLGVINTVAPCDGPTLLMVAEGYTEHLQDGAGETGASETGASEAGTA